MQSAESREPDQIGGYAGMTNWKPIETAPQDRPIIVKGGHDSEMHDLHELTAANRSLALAPTKALWRSDYPEGWVIGYYDGGAGAVYRVSPTEWDELPE